MVRRFKLVALLVLLGFSVFVSVGLFVPSVYSWTPLEGHITQDTTLTLANSPYRVINDVTVDAGVKLTIEPGVKVEFGDGFSLNVIGSLYAVGTSDRLINFTSSRPAPSPGVWNTIKFIGGKDSSFIIKYSVITYAKNGITIATDGYALIEKCEIRNNSESGIILVGNSNVMIRQNIIKRNKSGIATDNTNTHAGIMVIENEILNNQADGIYLNSNGHLYNAYIYNITFGSNIISSNGGTGVSINSYSEPSYSNPHAYLYNVTFLSNTISSNGADGIRLGSYSYGGLSYAYIYDVAFLSNKVFSNGGTGIRLISNGDLGYIYDVTFMSNTISLNNENGIYLSSATYIYNVILTSDIVSSNDRNGMQLEASTHSQFAYDLSIQNCTVSANNQKGLWLAGEININLTGNSISYNWYGVFFTTAKNNLVKYNDIYGNTYGMNVTSDATVNAEYNYWGDASGPYHLSLNPDGKGNSVNGNGVDLDFIPFLSAPIGQINDRPFARLTADKTSISKGQTVTFDASASTDDGRVDKYFFGFGDGKNSSWTTLSVIKHDYTSVGIYTANLTVMDDFGVKSTNTATVTITVSQQLPTLTVSLSLNPTIVNSGANVSIQVHVISGTSAIKDAQIQLVSDKGGTFTPTSGYTNANGDFSATFKAPTVSEQTNVRITATASKSGYNDGSDYEYVTVLPPGVTPPTLSVSITANPTTIQSGQTSTITTRVTHGGTPISGATVTLSSNKGGALSTASGNTDSNGYLTATFTAPTVTTQTTITITANATKTGYLSGQSQTQITVNPSQPQPQPQPQPQQPDLTLWIYIAVVIIVLISIGGGVAIARRRSHKTKA